MGADVDGEGTVYRGAGRSGGDDDIEVRQHDASVDDDVEQAPWAGKKGVRELQLHGVASVGDTESPGRITVAVRLIQSLGVRAEDGAGPPGDAAAGDVVILR